MYLPKKISEDRYTFNVEGTSVSDYYDVVYHYVEKNINIINKKKEYELLRNK